jgi:hypothetical protein
MNVTILKETPIADYIHQAGVDLGLSVGEDYNDMTNLEGKFDGNGRDSVRTRDWLLL